MKTRALFPCAFACLALIVRLLPAQAPAAKQKISSEADLPRFNYPLEQPPSVFLTADDATFNAFASGVLRDINSLLNNYDIQDKATLRTLYHSQAEIDYLTAQYEGALTALKNLHDVEEKPEARATTGFLMKPLIQAHADTGARSAADFAGAFQRRLQAQLDSYEWRIVQDTVKGNKASLEVFTKNAIIGSTKHDLDPAATKSGGLDLGSAQQMISARFYLLDVLPFREQVLQALSRYVSAHNVKKPDIWAAREVTFTAADQLTPVRIGIWDSGVDTSLFPNQLFTDPAPGAHSPHGLAYDLEGNLYNGDLQPLNPEQKAAYPEVVELFQGFNDLDNGIESPAATKVKQKFANTPPDQMAAFMKNMSFLGQWLHGTHVAGIAVRGNPAARLVVAQFNDSLPDMPFAPTVEWANKFKADFLQIGEYFRDNNVRVVNMSWADDVPEFEQWLSKTSSGTDPAARKQLATTIYQVWRNAVEGAIQAAPNTLFVCAAGNSDSDTGFIGEVPAGLRLPNLISVAAVDQAGEETSFTSYGATVLVDADGYQVDSVVPGGTRVKLSGTSMASPNVVNLAAKLIALNPSLTPEQVIDLIRRGADPSADDRRHLINPKATVALLQQQTAQASTR